MAVADKDRQIAELQRQVAELQAKAGGSVGSVLSPPVVPVDTRAGVWHLEKSHPSLSVETPVLILRVHNCWQLYCT